MPGAENKTSWSVETRGHRHTITDIAFTEDGARFATGCWDGAARISDSSNGELVRAFLHDAPVGCVAWSPDGKTLVSAEKRSMRLRFWDLDSGKDRNLTLATESIVLAWSPDGKRLAVGGADAKVYIVDPVTCRVADQFSGHRERVLDLAWSPDSNMLASSGKEISLLLWDAISGAKLRSLEDVADAGRASSGAGQNRHFVARFTIQLEPLCLRSN